MGWKRLWVGNGGGEEAGSLEDCPPNSLSGVNLLSSRRRRRCCIIIERERSSRALVTPRFTCQIFLEGQEEEIDMGQTIAVKFGLQYFKDLLKSCKPVLYLL